MSTKPENNGDIGYIDQPFFQQEMRACRPNFNAFPIPFILVFSTIHVALTVFIAVLSFGWHEVSIRYDNVCDSSSICMVTFPVAKTLIGPVFAYYELGNFYQNHFRFRGSRSYKQMGGAFLPTSGLSDCAPLILSNTSDPDSPPLAPCGLRAYYMFTDDYSLPFVGSNRNITWYHEISSLYKPISSNYTDNRSRWMKYTPGLADETQNERFAVWMRTSPTSQFRKLHTRISQPIFPGNYTVNITMNYPKSIYNGPRSLVFVSQSWAGGRNYTLISLNAGCALIYLLTALISECMKRKPVYSLGLRSSINEALL